MSRQRFEDKETSGMYLHWCASRARHRGWSISLRLVRVFAMGGYRVVVVVSIPPIVAG